MLKKPYRPEHGFNRMRSEGDVGAARANFFKSKSHNLKFLLQNRFEWMNQYIKPGDKGVEVGAGAGLSKLFIKADKFLLSDYAPNDWLDVKNVDALKTPFADAEFDFVVSSNMIHHTPYPVMFFEEMRRILKPGGVLLIQEINASFFMRLILKAMRHEGYSFEPDVFDRNKICTDPNDLWSANCAIPNLLFDDVEKFKNKIPYFRLEKTGFSEFFNFINSGGVIAKTVYVPLPIFALKILKFKDDILTRLFPQIFALQRQIVLRKI
ncbi:MAG: class I SAM-dependent methyltransferase [Candidatus Liptonbacteria bacterium]|nr:class I SAM-dependent methyltransferase [Candidatus Liptonbacteria bacterium]